MRFIEGMMAIGAGNLLVMVGLASPDVIPLISANTIPPIANPIASETFLDFIGFGDPDVMNGGWSSRRRWVQDTDVTPPPAR